MRSYDSNNIFAKILRGELPCNEVYNDEEVFVFQDKYPDAPVHLLVIPKKSYLSFDDFISKSTMKEIVHFFKVIREITHKYGMEKTGYRLVTNHGDHGKQVIPHFHFHVLGGRDLGKHINNHE